ncbi:hypothetical protein FA15DRAFT_597777 [Coprinopsis marcescibilis]|uniref:SnoaL-like domain-containing protein n=1 Tax=Coprinopsis marcescibilis TaxID=230819 RepID=A0A5C3KMH6_COPMA|nr:hypothetical protein FA15DRAFT_597777 [Coprinopsis marcescibilis]
MRFFSPLIALFSFSILTSLSIATPIVKPGRQCDPKAKGHHLPALQEAAIKDFAHLFLVEKDVKKAFNKYIPGTYIQHNPDALSGRQAAIDFLVVLWASPGMRFANITAWAGEGIGMMHYRMTNNEADNAVMDRLRFEGTCFVEHWDVIQRIYGNETNPIAFF